MKRIVIDASVVLRWYLADETHIKASIEIMEGYVFQELNILAPNLLEYEVLNGLYIAGKKGRIDPKLLIMAVEGFFDLGIEIKDISSSFQKILHFSEVYDITVYDSSYLSLASKEGIELVTADEKLYNKIKKELSWVKWLGDIS